MKTNWVKILTKINFGVNHLYLGIGTQANPADAPTLYKYDERGFISPTDQGRPFLESEKQFMDNYNKKWVETNKNWADLRAAGDKAVENAVKDLIPLSWEVVSPWLGTAPDPTYEITVYVDPLILDLDGDGLEITPLNQTPRILFDAYGDGIRSETAWVGEDDGFVVWDRNGNGIIDSGCELFGDETVLANGKKAKHGFEAIADLDSNADGKFDSTDARYGDLRIWRDINLDGVSQSSELRTLADSGVQAIQLATNPKLINYNDAQLVQEGTFTRSDGSEGSAGSFILAQNNFNRTFSPITVSADAAVLPNLSGSGWVRGLRETATEAPELIDSVQRIRDAGTQAQYKSAVAALIREWGNDSIYQTASKRAQKEGFGLILSDPENAEESGWLDIAIKGSDAARETFRTSLDVAAQGRFDVMRERMVGGLEKLYAYEAFSGYTFLSWSKVHADSISFSPPSLPGGGIRPILLTVSLTELLQQQRNAVPSNTDGYIKVTMPRPVGDLTHIDNLWTRLTDDVAENLLAPMRLSKFIDLLALKQTGDEVIFDFSAMDAALNSASMDPGENAILFGEMFKLYGKEFQQVGWNAIDKLFSLAEVAAGNSSISNGLQKSGIIVAAAGDSFGTYGTDVYTGSQNADNFDGGWGDDLISGGQGNDTLSGGLGNDVVWGDDGNDIIRGGNGNDLILGGAGSDTIDGGQGDDILDGGDGDDILVDHSGNNSLKGGLGKDLIKGRGTIIGGKGDDSIDSTDIWSGNTYIFDLGDGSDKLKLGSYLSTEDSPNLKNILKLGAGITPQTSIILRKEEDLTFLLIKEIVSQSKTGLSIITDRNSMRYISAMEQSGPKR